MGVGDTQMKVKLVSKSVEALGLQLNPPGKKTGTIQNML